MKPDSYYFRLIRGQQRGLIASVLRAILGGLSKVYALVIGLRNARYDRNAGSTQAASVPVISVGNLVTGGTGKTPMVVWVLRQLIGAGFRPGVLMRGYRARSTACCSANEAFQKAVKGCDNDEARELSRRCPEAALIIDPDRVAGARRAAAMGCDVLVMDDGFQHRRLARDLDVVLLDATCPFGGGAVLPRGMLREPADSLRRAHLVILTRCDQVLPEALRALRQEVGGLAPGVPIAQAVHRPVELCDQGGRLDTLTPLSSLAGRRVWLFAGLGNPSSFVRTVEQLGAAVVGTSFWPDHYTWTDAELTDMAGQAKAASPDWVLTSEKDAVRLPPDHPRWPVPLRVVRIGIQFDDADADAVRRMILAVAGTRRS